jgi:hypothetical protein
VGDSVVPAELREEPRLSDHPQAVDAAAHHLWIGVNEAHGFVAAGVADDVQHNPPVTAATDDYTTWLLWG